MKLAIDGYVPADPRIALEEGATFVYPTKYGDITIRAKMAGRDNVPFAVAMQNYLQWLGRREKLKGGADDEADDRLLGMVHDHLVIAWSTTITSGGKPIAESRENFIELMKSPPCRPVLGIFLEDVADETNFRPLSDEEAEKN